MLVKALGKFRYGNWFIPVVSGLLILLSFGVQYLFAGQWNATLTPRWWFAATEHSHETGHVFTLSNALMLAGGIVAGYKISVNAVRALQVKFISIDLLVSIAALGAVLIGNFWESAAVTFLFSVGHALEAGTMNKTRAALAELVAVVPDQAVVLRNGEQVQVPATEVKMGETVLVKNGAKIPVDGLVISGTGAIDEATITGESIPVEKSAADQVFAGTISHGGFLQVKATGTGADTTLARIIHRVEEAQDAKAKTQTFIDRFSKWYTPAVMLLALLAWLISADVVLGLTLLVIGCPGALVISIPVAIVAGIGRSARNGILIKGGEYLENAARITAVAVDKTGTLTEGRPVLTDIVVLDPKMDRSAVLRWAAGAETGSEHPLAAPILDTARDEGVSPTTLAEDVTPVIGKGIVAHVEGQQVLVGNTALMAQYGITELGASAEVADELSAAGKTAMIIALEDRVIAVIAVADTIRAEAPAMIRELHAIGVKKVVMLTGDSRKVAEAIAAATGIDEIQASLFPEDKLAAVAQMQSEGHVVAMVGDGVNDAPALATADIGVAMGAAGSAVAVQTADIALMGDRLLKLPEAIWLAQRTVRIMRQNITIALGTVLILLAGVFAGGVSMSLGMLVHEGSVLIVILNAMRLMRVRPTQVAVPDQVATGEDQKNKAALR